MCSRPTPSQRHGLLFSYGQTNAAACGGEGGRAGASRLRKPSREAGGRAGRQRPSTAPGPQPRRLRRPHYARPPGGSASSCVPWRGRPPSSRSRERCAAERGGPSGGGAAGCPRASWEGRGAAAARLTRRFPAGRRETGAPEKQAGRPRARAGAGRRARGARSGPCREQRRRDRPAESGPALRAPRPGALVRPAADGDGRGAGVRLRHPPEPDAGAVPLHLPRGGRVPDHDCRAAGARRRLAGASARTACPPPHAGPRGEATPGGRERGRAGRLPSRRDCCSPARPAWSALGAGIKAAGGGSGVPVTLPPPQEYLQLADETLYLAVYLMNAYLKRSPVRVATLQLLSLACLFLACKVEESTCPPPAQLCFMAEDSFSPKELLSMERRILSRLRFELHYANPVSLLHLLAEVGQASLEVQYLAMYFMELSLMETDSVAVEPAQLAVAALCLAQRILCGAGTVGSQGQQDTLPKLHVYSDAELAVVYPSMAKAAVQGGSSVFRATFRKYSRPQKLCTSTRPALADSAYLRCLLGSCSP